LKRELETVEDRFMKTLNQNTMAGEDFRSMAFHNMNKFIAIRLQLHEKTEML